LNGLEDDSIQSELVEAFKSVDGVLVTSTEWATQVKFALSSQRPGARPVIVILVLSSGKNTFTVDMGDLRTEKISGSDELEQILAERIQEALGLEAQTLGPQSFKFKGFISYSHANTTEAKWLHRALDTYRIPRELVGKVSEYGQVQRNLGRFYRDEDEISGRADLGAAIRGALEESQTMVVICSPQAAASQWVDREIEEFKRLDRQLRIVPVIVDGIPNDPDNECFPGNLLRVADSDGRMTDDTIEPAGVDLGKLGKARTIAKVVAGITGLEFDELWRREKRRIAQRRLVSAMVTSLVGVLILSLMLFFVGASGRADSTVLAAEARIQSERGHHDRALRLALIAARPTYFVRPAPEAGAVLAGVAQESLLEMEFRDHAGPVRVLSFSPDGELLATAGLDGQPRIWNAETGHLLHVLEDNSYPMEIPVDVSDNLRTCESPVDIQFSPLGDSVATAGPDNRLRLWSIPSGTLIASRVVGAETNLSHLDFTSQGDVVAAAGSDGWVGLWNFRDDATVTEWQLPNPSDATAIEFGPGGRLATAGSDGTAQLWSISGGAPTLQFHFDRPDTDGGHEGAIRSIDFAPNGQILATSGRKGVRLWSTATGEWIRRLDGHHHAGTPEDDIFDIEFTAGGEFLAGAAEYDRSWAWDLETPWDRLPLCCHGLVHTEGRGGTRRSGATDTHAYAIDVLSTDNLHWITSTGIDRSVRIWQIDSQTDRFYEAGSGSEIDVMQGHSAHVCDIAFLPTPNSTSSRNIEYRIATVSDDGTARIWRFTPPGVQVQRNSDTASEPRFIDIALNPYGQNLALLSSSGAVHLLDHTGRRVAQHEQAGWLPSEIAFSDDGSSVTLWDDSGHISAIDPDTGRIIDLHRSNPTLAQQELPLPASIPDTDSNTVYAHSVDGRLLATSHSVLETEQNQFHVSLWNATYGNEIAALDVDASVTSMSFNASGTRIAAGGADGVIRLLDVRSGSVITEFSGHWGEVSDLEFSPDESILYSAGEYESIGIWDVRFASELNHGDLHDAVCTERLIGDDQLSSTLNGTSFFRGVRRISMDDIDASTVLTAQDLGREVCVPPTIWQSFLHAIRGAMNE